LLTPEERSLRAKIAAHSRWAREDPAANAARAQAGLDARFDREVREEFPDLPEAEIARRVEHAKKAHFTRLALKSVQARRRDREASGGDAA
jgi:hypothetical protein